MLDRADWASSRSSIEPGDLQYTNMIRDTKENKIILERYERTAEPRIHSQPEILMQSRFKHNGDILWHAAPLIPLKMNLEARVFALPG